MTPGRRAYTRILLTLVAGVAAWDIAMWGLDLASPRSLRHLGIGAALALAGCLAWEIVARRVERPGVAQPLAWVAFPAAMLLAAGAGPFLALSVYPPLEGLLFRVEARVIEPGGALEIAFPRPMEPDRLNLRVGAAPLPDSLLKGDPALARWTAEHVLQLELEELLRVERWPRPAWIEINTVEGAPPMRYRGGDAVPRQRVPLR